jgi:hypothetical protein
MIANTEACHLGEGSKALNRLPRLAEPPDNWRHSPEYKGPIAKYGGNDKE